MQISAEDEFGMQSCSPPALLQQSWDDIARWVEAAAAVDSQDESTCSHHRTSGGAFEGLLGFATSPQNVNTAAGRWVGFGNGQSLKCQCVLALLRMFGHVFPTLCKYSFWTFVLGHNCKWRCPSNRILLPFPCQKCFFWAAHHEALGCKADELKRWLIKPNSLRVFSNSSGIFLKNVECPFLRLSFGKCHLFASAFPAPLAMQPIYCLPFRLAQVCVQQPGF